MDIDKLIKLVKQKPILYDMEKANFYNQKDRIEIWLDISKQLKANVDDCRKKWSSLRSTYNAYKRKENDLRKKNKDFNVKWKYMDQLKFLDKYLRSNRKLISNLEDQEANALSQANVVNYSELTNILENPLPRISSYEYSSKNHYTEKSSNNDFSINSIGSKNYVEKEFFDEDEDDNESDFENYNENIGIVKEITDEKRFSKFFNEDIQITIWLLIIVTLMIIGIIFWP